MLNIVNIKAVLAGDFILAQATKGGLIFNVVNIKQNLFDKVKYLNTRTFKQYYIATTELTLLKAM